MVSLRLSCSETTTAKRTEAIHNGCYADATHLNELYGKKEHGLIMTILAIQSENRWKFNGQKNTSNELWMLLYSQYI